MPKNSKKDWFKKLVANEAAKIKAYKNKYPHRSFRLSRKRDYDRPLVLPGYISFTIEVTRTLWKYKKTFAGLIFVYVVAYAILVGLQSQQTITSLTDTLKETSGDFFTGGWGAISQAGLLLLNIASSGVSAEATEAQQIFSVILFLMIWLATVWLLRNLLAGHKVKLRDGLYNSGAPIFATAFIGFVILVQLIPVAVAFLAYSAATGSGLIDAGGAGAMLFWIGVSLLVVLSLYWITSSLFAMIVVTLPGTYPMKAIQVAGDLMLGRRIKMLTRWLWMGLMVVLTWIVIMIPVILIDMAVKSAWPAINWLPVIPVVAVLIAASSTVWVSAYVYLLYRKVIDYVSDK